MKDKASFMIASIMKYAEKSSLREHMYRAYATRASYLSEIMIIPPYLGYGARGADPIRHKYQKPCIHR